jgi:3-oxoadipate enol-lactonase
MPYARRTGVSIYYETFGEGQPIVLIHANQFDRRVWMFQIATFAQRFRVLAVDLRGYGRSDKPETAFSLRDMADDVLAVCEHEGVTRAIFAGISVGSGIALLIGLDRPEVVDALVLVGGSSGGSANSAPMIEGFASPQFPAYFRSLMPSLFAPGYPETPLGAWVIDFFNATIPSLSGRSIAEVCRARSACNMTDRLPGLKLPTLVVNGEHDMSLSSGRKTAGLVPGAQHVVLPRTGHMCNVEDPLAFDATVLHFLSNLGLGELPRTP